MTVASLTFPNAVELPLAASLPVRPHIAIWFAAVHLLGMIYIVYVCTVYGSTWTIVLGIIWFELCKLSIRCGVHALYSHRALEAHWIYEVFVLFFSSGTFQYSAKVWAYFHAGLHHSLADTARDPYCPKHGIWWAHHRWVLHTPPVIEEPWRIWWLQNNRLLNFQDTWYGYYSLAALAGIGIPTLIAWSWGDPLGGFLSSFTRLIFQYHLTWYINSGAHSWGERLYNPLGTARAKKHGVLAWILAYLTGGESWDHARHHDAEEDYRIGAETWAMDPGKWFIWGCSKLGLVWNLKRVPEEDVWKHARRSQERMAAA